MVSFSGAVKTDSEAEVTENSEGTGGRGGRGGKGGGRGGRGGRGGGRGGKSGGDPEKRPTGPLENVTIVYSEDAYSGKKIAEASNGMELELNAAGTPMDKKGVPLKRNEDGTWSQQSNGYFCCKVPFLRFYSINLIN